MSLSTSPPSAPLLLAEADDDVGLGAQTPGRRVYEVSEYGFVAGIGPDELYVNRQLMVYPEVLARGYAMVRVKDGRLVLQAGGYVGLIPINDTLQLNVRPRVALDKLERLLTMSGLVPVRFRPHQRTYEFNPEPAPSLLDMFAEALLDAIAEIDANGLHREYQTRLEDTSFPRGRVMLAPTMVRHSARGAHHRAVASWFDHTADTGPNRCLKYALWFVARRYAGMQPKPAGAQRMVTRLNLAYRLFDAAELDRGRHFLDDPLVREPARMPSVRGYYRQALAIAVAIIRDRGVTLGGRGDDILMTSLLVGMDDVFEGYIRAVLRQQFRQRRPELLVLNGNHHGPGGGSKLLFDLAPSEDATPDVVVRNPAIVREGPEHPLIVEVKYKPFTGNPVRDDLNQTITYGASYACPTVVVAHPRALPRVEGEKNPRRLGTIGGIGVYQYAFDLGAPSLEVEEAAFGSALAALA